MPNDVEDVFSLYVEGVCVVDRCIINCNASLL